MSQINLLVTGHFGSNTMKMSREHTRLAIPTLGAQDVNSSMGLTSAFRFQSTISSIPVFVYWVRAMKEYSRHA